MTAVVWLVLRKDDPFVAGGYPEAAFASPDSMWAYLAEVVAMTGYARWEREKRSGSRMSHADAQRHEAAGWEIDCITVRP